MSEHNNASATAVWVKLLYVWVAVGFSQMTPLQWAQFIAAIFAIIYSFVQTWILLRDKLLSKDKP